MRRSWRLVAAWLVSLLARLIVRTLRVRFLGPPPASLPHPCIYAFAHGRQVPLLLFPRPRTAIVASLSEDGRLQARVMRRFGFDVIDGSSSHGGPAVLAAALGRLAGGRDLAVAVDGPRGPRAVVKPGVVFLAARSGAPIVPLSAACTRAWRFRRSWDGFLLPKPFARVIVVSGKPIPVPPDLPLDSLEGPRARLEAELGRLATAAEDHAA
ncbi:MAG: lysophospholipid acyltransferase family protein [Deltaproteobacteria bacterium]|nr:lysophospholipid acyltransferase family protein [Deltaproteobacteria bacterium]